MAAQDEVILYDIPSIEPTEGWSLNPWKTRMVPCDAIDAQLTYHVLTRFQILNYKKVPYTTQWVEYPDIEPTLKGFGIPPNLQNMNPYTSPAIKLGEEYIMDSVPISEALEKRFPEPSLHLDSPLLSKAKEVLPPVFEALRGVWMPKVPNVLPPRSAEYFRRTRAAKFGLPLDEYAKVHGGDKAWSNAEPKIQAIADLVKTNGGPFVMGKERKFSGYLFNFFSA